MPLTTISAQDAITEIKRHLKSSDPHKQAIENIIINLAGPDNRFERQNLMEIVTGEKIPLVKCGISHITDAVWKNRALFAPKKAEKSLDPNDSIEPTVGLKVTRKSCQRKGEVTDIDNGIVTVTLADGSIRRPNIERFKKLYI